MKNEFVTHDIALALKKLGFNEKCLACYDEKGVFGLTVMSIKKYYTNSKEDTWNCAAPLYQQAFRWFREKYNLRGFIGFRPNVKKFDYHVYDMTLSGVEYAKQRTMEEFNKDPKVGTYEETEIACLRKLIEIVKNKED